VILDQLPQELAPGSERLERIVHALNRAYFAWCASHDPEIGCDGYTFGTGIWRSSWFFLEQEFPDLARRPGNAFYLQFPEFNLYVYRDRIRGTSHRFIGDSGVQRSLIDINAQVCFDFALPKSSTARVNLVALHSGVDPAGLTELCIGLPVSHEDPDTAWQFIETVYTYRPEASGAEGGLPDVEPFDAREIPDINVQLERNDGASAGDPG
jgi:hypothetical protein